MMQSEVQKRLRLSLDPLKEQITELMNTPQGFLTDKDPKRKPGEKVYEWPVIRDAVVMALMKGFSFTNNEMNIIAGKFYPTKEGWIARLDEMVALTVKPVPMAGIPELINGRTTVRIHATWTYNDVVSQLIGTDGKPGMEYPIIVHSSTSADAVIGKAKAKSLRDIYHIITKGSTLPGIFADERDEAAEALAPPAPQPPKFDREGATNEIISLHDRAEAMGRMDAEIWMRMLDSYQANGINDVPDVHMHAIIGQLRDIIAKLDAPTDNLFPPGSDGGPYSQGQ